jgi:hypothetical protein
LLAEQGSFDQFADDVAGENMRLLNPRRFLRRNAYTVIDGGSHLPAILAYQTDCDELSPARDFHRADDIGGIAAGTDSEGNVTGQSDSFDLAHEYRIERVAVPNAGERRRVRRESQPGQAAALAQVSAAKC